MRHDEHMPFNDDWMLPNSVERASGNVYHYTSRAGLLGRIEGNAFWASEYRSLNDLSEVRHGWDLIESWVDKQSPSDAVNEIRKATEPDERPREVFVLSASFESDDANQWRLYAEDGSEYNIGIDTSIDLAVLKATADEPGRNKSTFASFMDETASVTPWLTVTYDDAKVEEHLDGIAAGIDTEFARIENTNFGGDEDGPSDAYWELRGATFSAIATVAALSKPRGFRGEAEARAIATLPHGRRHYRFRTGAAGVFPFVPLVSRPEDSFRTVVALDANNLPLPVESVMLGPRLREENINSVELLLQSTGYSDSKLVSKSAVPLA